MGSNALGVGTQDSRNGNSLVLANPHFPWRGIDRFWEFQLKIPGEFNAIGSSLMGFPAINIGHNKHVAWSHTVSTAQRFTLFELELDPTDPTKYMYDGESVPMTSRTVTVPVQGGGTESTTLWYSQFGPILARPSAGLSWTDTTVFALGDANDQIRAADTWLHMDTAKSAKDLIKAQSKYQGDPWVNTIGADDTGKAFYADNSVVPNVTQEKIDTCIKPGISTVIYNVAGLIPLDGSTPACNWGNDPDAAVKGIFGPSNLPIGFRKDYYLNANDSYWQTNAEAPLTGFSPIIGCEDCQQGLRTRLGHEMVARAHGRLRRARRQAEVHAREPGEDVARRPQPRRRAREPTRWPTSATPTRRSRPRRGTSTSPRRARSCTPTTRPACSTRRAAGCSTSGPRWPARARSGTCRSTRTSR